MKIIRFLDKWLEEILISCFMGYFVVAIVWEVIARALKISAPWTEETARYAFIWMTLAGSAAAVKHGNHVRVNILELYAPEWAKAWIKWISYGLFLVFCVIVFASGTQVCIGLLKNPQRTAVMQWSTVWVYGALPVGMGLTVLRLIQSMVRAAMGRSPARKEDML